MESPIVIITEGLFLSLIGVFVWCIIYHLIYPRVQATTAHILGRKWLVWCLSLPSCVNLPRFIRQPNDETFITWLAVFIFSALVGYILGFIVFYIRKGFANSRKVVQSANPSNRPKKGINAASEFYYGSLFKDIRNDAEDHLFKQALDEIESNTQDKVLWAKSLAASNGNVEKCKSLYINARVKNIKQTSLSCTKNTISPCTEERFPRSSRDAGKSTENDLKDNKIRDILIYSVFGILIILLMTFSDIISIRALWVKEELPPKLRSFETYVGIIDRGEAIEEYSNMSALFFSCHMLIKETPVLSPSIGAFDLIALNSAKGRLDNKLKQLSEYFSRDQIAMLSFEGMRKGDRFLETLLEDAKIEYSRFFVLNRGGKIQESLRLKQLSHIEYCRKNLQNIW